MFPSLRDTSHLMRLLVDFYLRQLHNACRGREARHRRYEESCLSGNLPEQNRPRFLAALGIGASLDGSASGCCLPAVLLESFGDNDVAGGEEPIGPTPLNHRAQAEATKAAAQPSKNVLTQRI